MKKLILSAVAVLAFGFANAQDTKQSTDSKGFHNGDIFISGQVGFNSTKTGDIKTNGFTIAPTVGFFVTDNIAIGGSIGYSHSKSENGVDEDIKTNSFGVEAFGRYYATPASDFSFFGQLSAGYATYKTEQGDAEAKTNGFGVALAPGISYFFSNRWAAEAAIGVLSYTSTKPDADGADSTNNFNLNVNLSNVTFGVVYKF